MTAPTVAGPRRPISHEAYTGAELETRSARPGAYDALALPSRMGDRQVVPGGARVSLPSAKKPKPVPLQHRAAPSAPPAPPPTAANAPRPRPYVPHVGSVADRVINELYRGGGHHLMSDLAQRHHVGRSGLYQYLKPGISAGVLVIHKVGHLDYVARHGYVMPAVVPDQSPAPIEHPTERPPTPRTDAAADLQRAIDSAQALATAFAQLERQTLIVAALIGDALARLAPPPASPFPTAA